MNVRLWVALDVSSQSDADAMLARLDGHRDIKVGMELFYNAGPEYVRHLIDQGYHIFLDLKCHDIPRTVGRAVDNIQRLGVELLTVHVAGGFEMLNAARQAQGTLSIVGVTVLTSLDPKSLAEIGVFTPIEELARAQAEIAMKAGIAGLVSSGGEVKTLRKLWPGARLVVPGIRRPGDPSEDQRRVFGPAEAGQLGASDIVVGRPITGSVHPERALEEFLLQLAD